MSISCTVASGKPISWHGRVLPNGKAGFSPEKVGKRTPVNAFDLSGLNARDLAEQDDLVQTYGSFEVARIKQRASALGLSNVPNSHSSKKRKPRGSSGLTSHGRSLVYNAINYLEWRFGPKHLSFLTVTLPSVTESQEIEITEQWAEIVRIFVQNLRRKLDAADLPSGIVGAFESQPKRSCREGGNFLHFHCVFVGRRYCRGWAITHEEARAAWRSAVISRVSSVSDCDFSASEHMVRVRKSAAGYLSKYLTKGSGVVGNVADPGCFRGPASWYSCSLHLRKIVCRSTRSGRAIGAVLSRLPRDSWLFLRAVRLDATGEDGVIIGWYGQLKPGWSQLFDVPVHVPIEESDSSMFTFPLPKVFHDGYFHVVLNVDLVSRFPSESVSA